MLIAYPILRAVLTAVPWVVALAWVGRTIEALLKVGQIPDLLHMLEPAAYPTGEGVAPLVSVIVPACNEEGAIAATVRSLLASRGVPVEVIAVDDRSTDRTGAVLDELAAEHAAGSSLQPASRLKVLHVRELPAGWLGKPHALALGVALSRAPLLLFTDADILFREDALLRAVGFFEKQKLDHLILASTPISKTAGERMMLGALQTIGVWSLRLWKIGDPNSKASLGVGSFGLVRREALEKIGGWEALRMEVLEDLRLGWEIKRRHGLRQQIAFGKGLLRLHWAAGALGIARNLTKNGFALFRYQLAPALVAVGSLCVLLFAPLLALAGTPAMRWSCLPFLLALALLYRRDVGQTGISPWYVLLFPFGAALFLFALTRSIVLTLLRGGVAWRGTLYPLAALRRSAGPLR
jgi:glycosyltransferase involved in cell wall biosynthesis